MRIAIRLWCLLGVMAFASPAYADLPSVRLSDIDHARANLVVAGTSGDRSYSPAELEAMGAREMTTVTPWRSEPATFQGVLLRDVLEANGLSDADAIRVVAENDYSVVIPSNVWRDWPILLATRVNGEPHSRRKRGPIQFVFPMSDDPALGRGSFVNNWVWMAARIEAIN